MPEQKQTLGEALGPDGVRALVRVQIAMWVGDAWCMCVVCGHKYESVDDFIQRDPIHVGIDHNGDKVLMDACHRSEFCSHP